ncbi:hypothetical protein TD95_004126 [Thielaviopsis punctulata]|uniref:DUF8004 domain-containing protein n=1 Tax=Thielaviopsis punctulata TaxID=72032 RepID=A0A0F4ZC76_9PEZI|nr:hypothetical protein TD95_004126 [Thielaviopsis punctulata]
MAPMNRYSSTRARRLGDFMEGRLPYNNNIKRWDGAARTCYDWDSLSKDNELWDRNGNCMVHLYAEGTARNGPSFKIPLSSLLSARCHPIIERYASRSDPRSILTENEMYNQYDSWARANPRQTVNLFITPPRGMDRNQSIRFYLSMRNLFAWICRRSLVGDHLGGAIVNLMRDMQQFRLPGTNNMYDLLGYLEEEGYLNMQNQPHHALAILYVSEYFQFREMYIDAFAHCVGMNSQLFLNSEYRYTSSVSQKLIRRARVEYDARLSKTSQMLQQFLNEEFSEHYLGLTLGGRYHMERFREFLIKFYIARFGQYPPPSISSRSLVFSKDVYDEMRTDFECLYEYLVDDSFTSSQNTPFLAQGGICTVQSVELFDKRCRFEHLSHPLPKLPEVVAPTPTRSMSITSWLSRNERSKPESRLVHLTALANASNTSKPHVAANSLVRAFRFFEEDSVINSPKTERKEKLSLVDARKIRWILVYGTYQSLRSVTEPPIEVREIESARYLMAVSTAGLPPWKEAITRTQSLRRDTDPYQFSNFNMPTATNSISCKIEPDINYLAPKHRNNSAPSKLSVQGQCANSNVGRAMSLGRSFAQGEVFRRLSIFKNPRWAQEHHGISQSHEFDKTDAYFGSKSVSDNEEADPSISPKRCVMDRRPSSASASMSHSIVTASRSHSTSSNSSSSTSATNDSYSTTGTSVAANSPQTIFQNAPWGETENAPTHIIHHSSTYIPSASSSATSSPISPTFPATNASFNTKSYPRTGMYMRSPSAMTNFSKPVHVVRRVASRPVYDAASRSQTMPSRRRVSVEDASSEWELFSNIGGHTQL